MLLKMLNLHQPVNLLEREIWDYKINNQKKKNVWSRVILLGNNICSNVQAEPTPLLSPPILARQTLRLSHPPPRPPTSTMSHPMCLPWVGVRGMCHVTGFLPSFVVDFSCMESNWISGGLFTILFLFFTVFACNSCKKKCEPFSLMGWGGVWIGVIVTSSNVKSVLLSDSVFFFVNYG